MRASGGERCVVGRACTRIGAMRERHVPNRSPPPDRRGPQCVSAASRHRRVEFHGRDRETRIPSLTLPVGAA
ncbi:hypothetical protein LC55x_3380 [Lysobacter capsici]|nr:hypothetical protein LC55x_3380 [Lysobacter capsici]